MLTVIPPTLREKRNKRPIQTKCNAFCNRKRIFGRIVCRPSIFAKCFGCRIEGGKNRSLRRPGVEPGSTAWKAAMLTVIPPTLREKRNKRPIQTKCNAFCNRKRIFGRIVCRPSIFAKCFGCRIEGGKNRSLRRPGVEPGSTAWKAAMLTVIPPTLREKRNKRPIQTKCNAFCNRKRIFGRIVCRPSIFAKCFGCRIEGGKNRSLRRPGVEPGSTAWKAAMLTVIPPTLREKRNKRPIQTKCNAFCNRKRIFGRIVCRPSIFAKCFGCRIEGGKNRSLRRPGVEPGSTAWKAAMLTVIPPTLREKRNKRPIQTKCNAFCNRKRIFGRIVCRPSIFAKCFGCRIEGGKNRSLRRPGVEPGSTAWKAAMLTVIPPTLREKRNKRPIQTKCNAFCNRKRIFGRIVCRPSIFAKCFGCRIEGGKNRSLRRPGVEPGSTAWKAAMLTVIPPTLREKRNKRPIQTKCNAFCNRKRIFGRIVCRPSIFAKCFGCRIEGGKNRSLRRPGVEPGSTAWKAAMLTVIPPTLREKRNKRPIQTKCNAFCNRKRIFGRIVCRPSIFAKCFGCRIEGGKNRSLRRPGVEPGSTAWKAAMLTVIPPTLREKRNKRPIQTKCNAFCNRKRIFGRIVCRPSIFAKCFGCRIEGGKNRSLRRPGVEPGSTAWKAAMLTVIPPTLREKRNKRPIQTKCNAFCNRKRIFGRIVCRPSIFAKCFGCRIEGGKNRSLRRPGVEPGSTAWKAAMLTVIPPTLREKRNKRPIQTKCNAFCNTEETKIFKQNAMRFGKRIFDCVSP
ncbi:hypothetical protein TNCV_4886221 [Trichonephila clavipes]|uniref:Uncharacterized protein n=1 Tax=Trichonephila clavipes TaxID=2585209 RepID=A0A8X6RI47_TRICX|nr:hypothetical protein TNCV_4886221 [Trichonephila clavipes]